MEGGEQLDEMIERYSLFFSQQNLEFTTTVKFSQNNGRKTEMAWLNRDLRLSSFMEYLHWTESGLRQQLNNGGQVQCQNFHTIS